jgi:hypothetical protein
MKVLKKIINKIDSAVMSPRLQNMLPGALETAERIANASTHSAKRYSRLLTSEVAKSAARGIGPGALIGAGYGLISDEESVIGGALKGAMTGAALAGGYATYRARAMLSSAGARSMDGVKSGVKSIAKRKANKTPKYITLPPPPREAAEQATKQAAEQATKTSKDVRIKQFKEKARIGELLKPYRDPETGRLTREYFDELHRMYNGRIPENVIKANTEAGIEIPYEYIYSNTQLTLDEF